MKKLKMKKNTYAGKLITFCGLDGCGKSTMIDYLSEELGMQGYSVFITKQPTDNVRCSKIFRTYMDEPNHDEFDYRSLSLLCASDRIQHTNKVIIPALKAGNIVLCDRYYHSCLANLIARGFNDDKWIYEVSKYLIKPDVAFFLDVPVDEAISRVRRRLDEKDRYIDIPLQYALRDAYLNICKKNGGVLVNTDSSISESLGIIKKSTERVLGDE